MRGEALRATPRRPLENAGESRQKDRVIEELERASGHHLAVDGEIEPVALDLLLDPSLMIMSTLRITTDATAHQMMVAAIPQSCVTIWPELPSSRPGTPPTASTAKTPVSSAPTMPPMPLHAEHIQAVVVPATFLSQVADQKQAMPAAMPIRSAPPGRTKPAAGVIATRPRSLPR